jgi:threonine/homoserine/homoserine lactone efflux protein
MVRVYLKRATSEPPKWMSKVQEMSPRWAFQLGLLLFIAMPTDIMMMITVGTFLASHGDPLWHAIGFIGLTGLLVAGPLLVLVVLGKRADAILPKVRDWMRAKSWVVSELVLLLFLILTASDVLKRL